MSTSIEVQQPIAVSSSLVGVNSAQSLVPQSDPAIQLVRGTRTPVRLPLDPDPAMRRTDDLWS